MTDRNDILFERRVKSPENGKIFGIDHANHQLILGSVRLPLPQSRLWRMTLGFMLVLGGFLGFLPVLGFWMVPLGLLVLSHDLAIVRRWRRRLSVWWTKKRRPAE
ncbi:hypothetical protein [Rhizobium sp. RAF56]|jgi:hypothetical protein|uniref:hypothetical protein n=1 Tax=Rhizobium sp. RAF56 TaxID=3233062 RepID=UPI003F950BF4